MKTLTTTSLIVTALLLIASPSASAALVAYEGFDYSPNLDIPGLSGGTGWTQAWDRILFGSNGVETKTAAALGYTDSNSVSLPTTGIGGSVLRVSRGASRTFPQRFDSGVAWVSYLHDPEYDTNATGNVYARIRDGGTNRLTIGMFGGSDTYLVNGTDTGLSSRTGAVEFFVARFDFGTGGNDASIHLFRNPDLGLPEPDLSDALYAATGLDPATVAFDRIQFAADPGGSPAFETKLNVDEIRVATDYGNVTGFPPPPTSAIPEPTALGVLGLGALALLRRR